MNQTKFEQAKKYISELIRKEPVVLPRSEVSLSPDQTKELEFLVSNGHWEVLPKNKTFLILSPEGQIQTLNQSLENRINILRTNLTPMGRSSKTRDAYIQILNHIHDLERLQEDIMKKFYAKLGKRQIAKESKGKKIDFY